MPRLPTIVTNCIQVIIFGSTLVFILISSSTLNYSNPHLPLLLILPPCCLMFCYATCCSSCC
jgi:hypothetical protein